MARALWGAVTEYRFLIIEDDPDQCSLIVQVVADHFRQARVVGVGDFASAMRQPLHSFDLILSDYHLPDADGLRVIDGIRAVCSTPVIIVTGENQGKIAADAIRRGAADFIVKSTDYLYTMPLAIEKNIAVASVRRENEELRRRLESALDDLSRKNHLLEDSLSRLEEVAATDALTGLYNRRQFAAASEQLFAEARRYDSDLACIMLDLDHFKLINDTLGHPAGDAMLKLVGKVIAGSLRRMDLAARYGGDEFILLLPRTSYDQAQLVAHRIADGYTQAATRSLQSEISLTMSIGIATLQLESASTAEQLIAHADADLYRNKRERHRASRPVPTQDTGKVEVARR